MVVTCQHVRYPGNSGVDQHQDLSDRTSLGLQVSDLADRIKEQPSPACWSRSEAEYRLWE